MSAYHEDEALVELVARGLYARAMSERNTFKAGALEFGGPWSRHDDDMKRGWREEARIVLGQEPGTNWHPDPEAERQ